MRVFEKAIMLGGNNVFKYDFSYDDILSPNDIKKYGILFNDEKFSFESYWENGFNHYERLFYSNNGDDKLPFSGLLYELYPNGIVSGYSSYKAGYQEGTNVDFYEDGTISKYMNTQADSKTLVIKWFRNGTISKITEISGHGIHKKYIEYDECGKIIAQGES